MAAVHRLVPGPVAASGRVALLALMRLNAVAVPLGHAPVELAVRTPDGLMPVPSGHPAHGGPVGPNPAPASQDDGDRGAG